MGRIRVLPDAVANQIAAGEVVERPASVVKELLENSLDAGAANFRIEVEGGGRRLIRIADDGSGMIQDDAILAFERHATSKLSNVQDLLAIDTLGFRGEALPSIASVSRLLLETRAETDSVGTLVELAGGKLLRVEPAALPRGTTITVRDLFYNVPARKKFLRSEQTELAHIASLVTHYSLAQPDKSFYLRHDGKELLQVTAVQELRERVFQVFGSQVLEDLIDLNERETELEIPPPEIGEDAERTKFRLRGFVSQPQVQKLNRNSIYLFVNGRLIRDRLLIHALTAAYHNLMPPACFPFALLFLECDASEVDVNVHPAKTEVRFRHGSFVHDFVRDAIRASLMESRPAARFPVEASAASNSPQLAPRLPYSEFTQQLENAPLSAEPSELPPAPVEADGAFLPTITLAPPPGPAPRLDFGNGPGTPVMAESPAPARRLPVPDTHGPLPPGFIPETTDTLASLTDLRPLGQLHDSFIICAGRDGLWIIDQHVAHERILFEQVLAQRARGQVERQQLLMPMVTELSAAQQLQYARIADELNAMGFDSEPFGQRTIAVTAAPAGLRPGDLEKVIAEILDIAETELRRTSVEDLQRNIAASLACRAAIKINTRLETVKMQWLLQALAACQYPMACPHGRPIALRYSMHEILRSFHRI